LAVAVAATGFHEDLALFLRQALFALFLHLLEEFVDATVEVCRRSVRLVDPQFGFPPEHASDRGWIEASEQPGELPPVPHVEVAEQHPADVGGVCDAIG